MFYSDETDEKHRLSTFKNIPYHIFATRPAKKGYKSGMFYVHRVTEHIPTWQKL